MFLIAYDITDPKRLRKSAKLLESHGIRVQYSVFELYLDRKEVTPIIDELRKIIDEEKDKLYVYPISEKPEHSKRRGKKSSIWEMIF